MSNIFLIHPDSGYDTIAYSLTLGTLGGSLKKAGHSVSYLLLDLPWNRDWKPSNTIYDYDIVGITLTSWDFEYALNIASGIKKINPDIPIIGGGAHPTFDPDSLLESDFDVCVRGEGDYTILDVVDAFVDSKKNDMNLKNIKGISYKNSKGKIIHNQDREIIKNLDDLPMPDWEQDDFIRIYKEHRFYEWDPARHIVEDKISFILSIESSRGCPYKCVFCTTSKIKGKMWRDKSVNRIMAEYDHFMKFVRKHINSDVLFKEILLHFPDDNFCYDTSRVNEFCKEMLSWPEADRPTWDIMARADKVKNRDLLELMYRSGCIRVFMGAESGYEKGLRKIKKGITLKMIEEAVDTIISINFPLLIISWIFGFPWEKRSDAIKTIIKGVNLTLKDPDKIKMTIYALTPIIGADITEKIGTYLVGRASDAGRFNSWGFDHTFMNDTDLFELQLVAGWFILLLDIKNYIPIETEKYKKTIFERIGYAETAEQDVKSENIKLFFSSIRELFLKNIHSKPEFLFDSVYKKIPLLIKIIDKELKN